MKSIKKRIPLPKVYLILFGGQYQNLARASKQLGLPIPLTLVIVFIFLFMLFKNIQDTLLTMSCILSIAYARGIGALLVRSYNFNVSAGVRFVQIFGISVMAGVLLILALNRDLIFSKLTLKSGIRITATQQFNPKLSLAKNF